MCQVYGVPVLSYRRALQDRFQRKNVSFFWADNLGEVHPPWTTHQMITDMITTYITAEATWMCSTSLLLKREIAQAPQFSFPLSPVFYSVNTEAADNCSSWRLYSQHADELALRNVSKLLPWFASEAQNHYAGWQLRSDVAGKPVGWIAESKASSGSALMKYP